MTKPMTVRVLDRVNKMKEMGCDANDCGYVCDTYVLFLENGTTKIVTAFGQKAVQAVVKKMGAKWNPSAKAWMVARRVSETEVAAINAAHDVKQCKPVPSFAGAVAAGEWPKNMTTEMRRAAQSGATYAEYIDGSAN